MKNCALENESLLISINFEKYYNEIKIKELIDNQLKIFNYQDIRSRSISDIDNIEILEIQRLTEDSAEKLKEKPGSKLTIDPKNGMQILEISREEGNSTKKYYYDEKTKTYFLDTGLIEKSRECEKFTEVSKLINDSMKDEEKYKIIYEYMVNEFNYNYKIL